ncbi:MAG: hypothetical protein PHT13_00355 [Methanosarcina sp.]|jgi:hypothetical protein|nr:hypothetical protein [Methanosarcina sp.]
MFERVKEILYMTICCALAIPVLWIAGELALVLISLIIMIMWACGTFEILTR